MKKITAILLCLFVVFTAASCVRTNNEPDEETTTVAERQTVADFTVTEPETTTAPETTTEPETETTTIETTVPMPEHSDLYINGVSTEMMVEYFAETVLSAEYSRDSGHKALVQKWNKPIRYYIHGINYNSTDVYYITEFFDRLNKVEGFPGAKRANLGEDYNLEIKFCTRLELQAKTITVDETCAAFTSFTFNTATDEIQSGAILYCHDIPKSQRQSVIQEEILNCMGMSDDTLLRTNSVIYQYSNSNTADEIDMTLFAILYSDRIKCGMNRNQCADAIKEIYY